VAHTGSTDRERTQKRRHIKALRLTGPQRVSTDLPFGIGTWALRAHHDGGAGS
jgi:hypothetical protein